MSESSNDSKQNKGGRKSTGTIQRTKDGRWRARITLIDGTRKWLVPYPVGTSVQMAKEKCAAQNEKARQMGIKSTAEPKPSRAQLVKQAKESCEAWVKLWSSEREDRGLTSYLGSKGHWTNYLSVILGTKHPKAWTPDLFRKLSAELDRKVQAGSIRWKTATNIWTTATKMAGDAARSKIEVIRCRDDNPAEGVLGPYTGDKTARQYLYPSELSKVLECSLVPLRWRRMLAISVYTFCRSSELRALTWDDIELDRGLIHVTKSIDSITGELKTTKSKCPRIVPIEPALFPLLFALHKESGGKGPVLEMPAYCQISTSFKRWLNVAGVHRASLTAKGPSVRPIRFHDLRATGITWSAVRGDEPLRIQQRAGHTDFSTTQEYIREAEILRDGFGQPFPTLPTQLCEIRLQVLPTETRISQKRLESLRRREDSNLW